MRYHVATLLMFVSAASAQPDPNAGIMPPDWRPDWYVDKNETKKYIEHKTTGESLWNLQPRKLQQKIANQSERTFRDKNGQYWYNFERLYLGEHVDRWFNLSKGYEYNDDPFRPRRTRNGKIDRPKKYSVSSTELLGAIFNEDLYLVNYYRRKVKVKDAVYVNKFAGRKSNGHGQFTWIYEREKIRKAEYDYRWFYKREKPKIRKENNRK